MRRADTRIVMLAAAAALFALAAWNPRIPLQRSVGTYLWVYDITQSMNVQDTRWDGQTVSRLQYAQSLSRAALSRLPCGSRVGVGLFVERQTRAILAPLEVCAHRATLDGVIAHLDWRMAWAAESHIEIGSIDALAGLRRDMHGASLVLFTDGDQAPQGYDERTLGEAAAFSDVHGLLLGIGGTQPQPVPRLGAHGHVEGYWTARSGMDDDDATGPTRIDRNIESHLGFFRNSNEQQNQQAAKPEPPSLSWRHDEVLSKVAAALHLQTETASSAGRLVTLLGDMGTRRAPSALALGDGFGAIALLLTVASVLLPHWRARVRQGAASRPPAAPAARRRWPARPQAQ